MDEAPHEMPITGELDLHQFRPSDIGELIPEYLRECRGRGILAVRIIHGKGTGTLRASTHHILARLPAVREFQYPAGAASGGWGATWVYLHPADGGDDLPDAP